MASERNVVVRIKAEYGAFKADMAQVARAAEDAAKKSEDSGKRASSALGRLAQDATKNRAAWESTGTAIGVAGAAIVGVVGLSISKFAQFEKSMVEVQASTRESAENMGLLRQAALDAGRDTAYSADKAANAINELAKAGISTKDILGGGLAGALSLAAAGGLDVAEAAEIAAASMVQFKLDGSQVPHIADLLAAGANKAMGSVQDLGGALGQAGLVASSTGLSIEETVGGLAAFASAGLVGSDAGTSFKSMLQRLNPQSKEAQKLMAELGISAYDAEGNFIGLAAYSENLKTSLGGMSEQARASAMNVLFGSDAVRAANVLYEQGGEGIQSWIDKVDDTGYAAVTATIKQGGLLGSLEKLGGAFDTVLIKGGTGAGNALTALVQSAEKAVNVVGSIPEPMLATATSLAGIVGVTALTVGGFMRLAPAAIETVTNFRNLGTEGSKIPGVLGRVTKGLGLVAIGLAAISAIGTIFTSRDSKSAEEYANAILKVSQAGEDAKASDLDSIFQGWDSSFGQSAVAVDGMADAVDRLTNRKWDDGINQWADKAFGWTNLASSELTQVEGRLDEFGQTLADVTKNGGAESAAASFNLLTKEFERNGEGAKEALAQMPAYRDALMAVGQAAGVALTDSELLELATGKIPASMQAAQAATELLGSATGEYANLADDAAAISEEMADALAEVGLSADGTVQSLSKFIDMMQAAGLMTLSVRDASRGFQESVDGITEGVNGLIEKYGGLGGMLNDTGTDFNEFTAIGREAGAMFDGIAASGAKYTQALADSGASQEEIVASMQATRDALIQNYEAYGITGQAAQDLASDVQGIPAGVDIATYMDDLASQKVAELTGSITALPDPKLSTEQVMGQLYALHDTIQATPDKTVTITEPMSPVVKAALQDLGYVVTTLPDGTIQVTENGAAATGAVIDAVAMRERIAVVSANAVTGAAEADLNWTARERWATIHAHTVNTSSSDKGYSSNGGVGGLASGAFLQFNAQGTFNQLSPMSKTAQVVPPNTWRVVGDNMTHPEVYAPLNGSQRSLDIMQQGAEHMGYRMIPKDVLGFAAGGIATGGSVGGLSARPGEENWQWQSRQQRIVEQMADVVGGLADWEIHEDGSGWIRTMDNTMIEIADGSWKVSDSVQLSARAMERASQDAYWAGQTATAAGGAFQGAGSQAFSAGGSFQAAGVSANATAGTFTVAGQVTQQAAQAIIAATAAVNASGQQQAAVSGGGLVGQEGEAVNKAWKGRHDQFEQAMAQQYGGIKYSRIFEDGFGMMELDDGRKIDIEEGRWKFVENHRYGWGPAGPQLSKYRNGGRLPQFGPGTQKRDGFMGLSSMTGDPAFYADGGEWLVNRDSSAKHHSLLSDVNRDAPYLSDLKQYASTGRSMAQGYNAQPTAHGTMTATVDSGALAAALNDAMATWQPTLVLDGKTIHGVMNKAAAKRGLPGYDRRTR